MISFERWLEFFEQGGFVLWLILIVSSLMWMLIVERYWFLAVGSRKEHARLVTEWHGAALQGADAAHEWLRHDMLTTYRAQLQRALPIIKVMTAVLPLLGLLGTVSGMIATFNALTMYGSGNPRVMASGISEALFTTLAGLATAILGVYFSSNLEGRMAVASQRLEADLTGSDRGAR